MKQFILLLILMLLLTGCAHTTRPRSYLAPELPRDTISRAVDDLTAFLAAIYPPGQTALNMAPNKSAFHESLENSLRAKGFEITAPPSQRGLYLSYVIDVLEGQESYYLKAVLADGQVFSKVYFLNDSGSIKGASTHGQKVNAGDFQKTIQQSK